MLAKLLPIRQNVPIIPVKATQMIGEYVGEGSDRYISYMTELKIWLLA
jgi:AAA+ superfamily predicted ATPase